MRLLLACLSLFALASPVTAQITAQTPQVIATLPHDTDAFTQGLFWHDGQLIETTGQYGESRLRVIDPDTGIARTEHTLPQRYFGEGSVVLDDRIYWISWMAGEAFVFDSESFEPVETFTYSGQGWGLTTDGTHLVMSDGSPQIVFRNPSDFSIDRVLTVFFNGRPLAQINELEWVNGEIWANIWQTRWIVRINPQTGAVVGAIDLETLVPAELRYNRDHVANGVAYDAQSGRLFVTGKNWPVLYEIALPAPLPDTPADTPADTTAEPTP